MGEVYLPLVLPCHDSVEEDDDNAVYFVDLVGTGVIYVTTYHHYHPGGLLLAIPSCFPKHHSILILILAHISFEISFYLLNRRFNSSEKGNTEHEDELAVRKDRQVVLKLIDVPTKLTHPEK